MENPEVFQHEDKDSPKFIPNYHINQEKALWEMLCDIYPTKKIEITEEQGVKCLR